MKLWQFVTIIIVAIVVSAALLYNVLNKVKVDYAAEMVEIRQPLFFGKGGVNHKPYPTGRHFIWHTSKKVHMNLKPFVHVENFVDINTEDNVPVDFKASFVFQQHQGKTPIIVEKFGTDWYKQKVKAKFRTLTRNEIRTRQSGDLRTDTSIIEDSQSNIAEEGQKFLDDIGLEVTLSQVQIDKINPPEEVLTEAARTAAQKQRKKTQYERQLAEEQREAAERAAAIADKAYMTEIGMTRDQYLSSRSLDLRAQELNIIENAVKEGKVNLNWWISSGNQGGPVPTINAGQ